MISINSKACSRPLSEQAAIVHYLDHATAAIDSARRQIELLREYRTRLIADVVTGKLDVRESATRLPEAEEIKPERRGHRPNRARG